MNRIGLFWSKVTLGNEDQCWEWTASTFHCGYGMVRWSGQARYAHRVAWEMWYGEAPGEKCVLHKCDNRLCVNPYHLFLGDRGDNARDCWAKGRGPRMIGEKSGASKLKETDVTEIRRLYADGILNGVELAANYGVSTACIYAILRRDHWRHVA